MSSHLNSGWCVVAGSATLVDDGTRNLHCMLIMMATSCLCALFESYRTGGAWAADMTSLVIKSQ